jgi:hypothetical protein
MHDDPTVTVKWTHEKMWMQEIMATLYRFRLFCQTEQQLVYVWSSTLPTVCPNNNTHSVDLDSIVVDQTRSVQTVNISNSPTDTTHGFFTCDGKTFDVPASSNATFAWSYPYPIAMHMATATCTAANVGDSMSVLFAPNVVIGALMSNAASNDTVLRVSPSATAVAVPGYFVNVTNGVLATPNVRINSVSPSNGTLTLELPLGSAFSSNAFVRQNRYIVRDFPLNDVHVYVISSSVLDPKPVPANMPFTVVYHNASSNAKTFAMTFEYTY